MMRIREEFDADRDTREKATSFPSGDHQFPMICSMCDRTVYVSKEFSEKITRAIKEGLDNPYVCEECEREFGELEHLGH
jgi:hypothetical protein